MKRTALRKSNRRMKRTPLRKISKKGRMARYYQIRKPFIEANPMCQICRNFSATDVHHRKSRRGNLLFDTTWWMALCRCCHSEKVHGDVENAKKMGWLVPFWK